MKCVIADLVAENPRRASVFEEHDIDYCRAGQRSLISLCLEMGLDPDKLEVQLLNCDRNPFHHLEYALQEESLSELADYLEEVCHRELKVKAQRISQLLARVALVYSKCNPELVQVRNVFEDLRAKLLGHLLKEEQIYFAWIRDQDKGMAAPDPEAFEMAEAEHEELLASFNLLRSLTADYKVPDYACGSYRVVLSELSQLEADLKQFAGIEDTVLFRRAAVLAEEHSSAEV